MKAHRVKCQQCANGVKVVTCYNNDITTTLDPMTFVYAANMTNEQINDHLAEWLSVHMYAHQLTPDEVKIRWRFEIFGYPILS